MTNEENSEYSLKKKKKTPKWWLKQIKTAEKEQEAWCKQADNAYSELTFDKEVGSKGQYESDKSRHQHFSIYWATIQTAKPSIYNQTPTPIIKRRHLDDNSVARVGADIIDRMAKYFLSTTTFDNVIERVVENFLVASRGVARVYYKSKTEKGEKVYITPEIAPLIPETAVIEEDEQGQFFTPDILISEEVCPVWISYDSYFFTPGVRDSSEIWWKAQELYFDKQEFAERFGDNLEQIIGPDWCNIIPFNYASRKKERLEEGLESEEEGEFCRVLEIWNKKEDKVCWVCSDWPNEFLDEQDNIYDLKDFFPFPNIIQGTLGNKNFHPIPDYVQIRQSLSMLDYLQSRKRTLIKALRAKGVYDSSKPELVRLAREADEADLVPVDNFIELAEKGGLGNLIQYIDTSALAASLMQVYQAEDSEKQSIYEITGFSDIMRGSSVASESATAQQLKSEYGSIRLREKIKKVAYFARDLLELMCDLALARFSDETIIEMVGARYMSQEDQMLIPDALGLIREDKFRTFQIEIETDSTIAVQSQLEKDARIEFLDVFSKFSQQVIQVSQVAPALLPAMSDTLLYAIRGMRQATMVEGVIQSAFKALQEEAMQPPPEQGPDPKMQLEEMKSMTQLQIAQTKAEAQMMQAQSKAELESQKQAIEMSKIEAEREKVYAEVENIRLQASIDKLQAEMQLMGKTMDANKERVSQSSFPSELTVKMEAPKKVLTLPDGRTATITPIQE